MPLNRTEIFRIALRGETAGSLVLIPATPNRPWLLTRADVIIVTVSLPPEASFSAIFRELEAGLAAQGLEMAGCGNCGHWLAPAGDDVEAAGHCAWARAERPASAVSAQTALASPCQQFMPASQGAPAPVAAAPAPALASRPFWQRWLPASPQRLTANSLEERVVEQSGKRPGTIPCQVCPGRMANLGAQKCRTDSGDERTFSVWRCRTCLAYFLNDWTDKWVRTDSLEVVDIYYRLAPQEALECLARIEATQAKQTTSPAMQTWFESYLDQRPPARREVRHAR